MQLKKTLVVMVLVCSLLLAIHLDETEAAQNKPKGGHTNNQRPSTKNKHENADARRQREQQRAQERRDKQKKG